MTIINFSLTFVEYTDTRFKKSLAAAIIMQTRTMKLIHPLIIVFHKSLSNSKSPLVSRTLLSNLTNINNTVAWMVSIIVIFTPSKFITPALADGLSLEYE